MAMTVCPMCRNKGEVVVNEEIGKVVMCPVCKGRGLVPVVLKSDDAVEKVNPIADVMYHI